jgi:micrococcal nuclease
MVHKPSAAAQLFGRTSIAVLSVLFFLLLVVMVLGANQAASPALPSTPTPTLASSATSIPTLTPTIKPSTTAAATAAATATPTHTPAPTKTLTPTATSLPGAAFACIPNGALRQAVEVVEIVDGDTIKVRLEDGQVYSVRLIGIDAPERDQPLFQEASQAAASLLEGKSAVLIQDVSPVDPYDRLLRYVIAGDHFVNEEMVRSGFAYASPYPPDVACQETFAAAMADAQAQVAGLWLLAAPGRSLQGVLPTAAQRGMGGNCDPAYPSVCIPPPPPDLDCSDIPHRRFRVLAPDPHNFDRDRDGVGCES